MNHIGVDPGDTSGGKDNLGVAIWTGTRFHVIYTTDFWTFISALDTIDKGLDGLKPSNYTVIIEDPNLVKVTFPREELKKLKPEEREKVKDQISQKVGMNKAYARLIIKKCENIGLKVIKVSPANRTSTKMKADAFKRLTKYQGSTNEHGRDAAMLCFGR